MPRVYEVARELGISSAEAVGHLAELEAPVSSHASSIDDVTAERLREHVANGSGEPGGAGEGESSVPILADPPPEETISTPPKKKRSLLKGIAELPLLVLFAFAIAILIKTFFVQAFFIPSESMLPTLRIGDRVLVEKLSYFFGDPGHKDVVVFAKSVFDKPADVPWYRDGQNFVRELLGLPTGSEEDYIKRVVAIGGDKIQYIGRPRRLIINDQEVDEPYIKGNRDRSSSTITSKDCRRLKMEIEEKGCRVPAGRVFVMGDNRGNSEDSRVLGPISEDKIVGRAFVIIWPPGDFGGL